MNDGKIGEALRRLRAEIACDIGAVGVLQGEERELVWKAASGNLNGRCLTISEKGGRGVSDTVGKVGRAALLSAFELRDARLLQDYPVLLAEGLFSAYAVPIASETNVRGVLLAGDRRKRVYGTKERESCEAAADLIARLLDDRPIRVSYDKIRE